MSTINAPTLPRAILASPALSILLPIITGSLIGWTTRRTHPPSPPLSPSSPPPLTFAAKRTYHLLRQPPLRPPAWLFGPVWTLLYGMMGYASHLAYRQHGLKGQSLYLLQLCLNYAWMPLFFGVNRPGVAMGVLVLLEGTVVALAGAWEGAAGMWLWPYCAWVGFAGYLNAGVGMLNGWDVGGYGRGEKRG